MEDRLPSPRGSGYSPQSFTPRSHFQHQRPRGQYSEGYGYGRPPRQASWSWNSPNYGNYPRHFQSSDYMGGGQSFDSPPHFFSSTPRKPFHQRRGNFHQQSRPPRFHQGGQGHTQSTFGSNIENWVSSKMWEDPWIHLLPESPVPQSTSEVSNAETEQNNLADTGSSNLISTMYFSALDTSCPEGDKTGASESIIISDSTSDPVVSDEP